MQKKFDINEIAYEKGAVTGWVGLVSTKISDLEVYEQPCYSIVVQVACEGA